MPRPLRATVGPVKWQAGARDLIGTRSTFGRGQEHGYAGAMLGDYVNFIEQDRRILRRGISPSF